MKPPTKKVSFTGAVLGLLFLSATFTGALALNIWIVQSIYQMVTQ